MNQDSENQFRYFIIPHFNPSYNIEKLKERSISDISTIHSKYLENNQCFLFVYTKKKCTEAELRTSFSNLSTCKNYISIEECDTKSTRFFLLSTFPPHKQIAGVKKILNTFARGSYKVTAGNDNPDNCIYWQIDFKSITLAKHAINFIPKLKIANSEIFFSSDPFDIPLIQFSGININNIQNFLSSKEEIEDIKFENLRRSLLLSDKRYIYILAEDDINANKIIAETNHEIYKNQEIIAQNYINAMTFEYLNLFEAKVLISDIFSDIKDFYKQMTEIGPVYQVYEMEYDKENYYVIFQSKKTIRKLINSEVYSASLTKHSIYTLYNFPPNSTEKELQKYLEKSQINFQFMIKCEEKENCLPHFLIYVNESDEENLTSFFNSPECIYKNKTRPICVKYLQEHEFELSCGDIINSSNTLQIIPENAKTITDIYNKYSHFGVINLLFYDRKIRRFSLSFRDNDSFINAKKYLESNYPLNKTILVTKEKKAVIVKKDSKKLDIEKNTKNIQIPKRSLIDLSFLISSDDESDDENKSPSSTYSRESSSASNLQTQTDSGQIFSRMPQQQKTIFNIPQKSKATKQANNSGNQNKSSKQAKSFIKSKKNNYNIDDRNQDDDYDIDNDEDMGFVVNNQAMKPNNFNRYNLKSKRNIIASEKSQNEGFNDASSSFSEKKLSPHISNTYNSKFPSTNDIEDELYEDKRSIQRSYNSTTNKKIKSCIKSSRTRNSNNQIYESVQQGKNKNRKTNKTHINTKVIKNNGDDDDSDDEYDIIFVPQKPTINIFNIQNENTKCSTMADDEDSEPVLLKSNSINSQNSSSEYIISRPSKQAKKHYGNDDDDIEEKESPKKNPFQSQNSYRSGVKSKASKVAEAEERSPIRSNKNANKRKTPDIFKIESDDDDDENDILIQRPKRSSKQRGSNAKNAVKINKIDDNKDKEEEEDDDEYFFQPQKPTMYMQELLKADKKMKKENDKKSRSARKNSSEDEDENDNSNYFFVVNENKGQKKTPFQQNNVQNKVEINEHDDDDVFNNDDDNDTFSNDDDDTFDDADDDFNDNDGVFYNNDDDFAYDDDDDGDI